jgi:hypothetical protein
VPSRTQLTDHWKGGEGYGRGLVVRRSCRGADWALGTGGSGPTPAKRNLAAAAGSVIAGKNNTGLYRLAGGQRKDTNGNATPEAKQRMLDSRHVRLAPRGHPLPGQDIRSPIFAA